jgi:copper chaperone CopZ
MKTIKTVACVVALGFAPAVGVAAGSPEVVAAEEAEAKSIEYVAGMTGITCGGCESGVRAAFMKLPGVTEVKFTAGSKPKTKKVTVLSAQGGITKEDAVKALGKTTKFVVVTWSEGSA